MYTYSGGANALSLDPRVLLARGWSLLKTNSTVAGSCTACVVTLDRCADISVPTVRYFSTSLQKTKSQLLPAHALPASSRSIGTRYWY